MFLAILRPPTLNYLPIPTFACTQTGPIGFYLCESRDSIDASMTLGIFP